MRPGFERTFRLHDDDFGVSFTAVETLPCSADGIPGGVVDRASVVEDAAGLAGEVLRGAVDASAFCAY